jgi:NAD(P)-dependent dehydrogenase (short-subunit alcohol dehydrogenase family)
MPPVQKESGMRGLDGKRFVVAGGATGIGAATAKRLAEEGARVVVGDVNMKGLDATIADIKAGGGTAKGMAFDFSDPTAAGAITQACIDAYGGIDGLANVGADLAALKHDTNLLDASDESWERQLDCNFMGYMRTIRAALPHFLAQNDGAIVNVSSMAAFMGEDERPGYGVAKAGINAMTRHVARRWSKDNIRINSVAPGLVLSETAKQQMPMETQKKMVRAIAMGRPGTPEDLAATICFLLSGDGVWITGQVWTVNGGHMFRE